MNDNTFKVYDLKEVCSILKISLQVLRRYIKKGEIKASKIGRKYVITAEALEDYLTNRTLTKDNATKESKTLKQLRKNQTTPIEDTLKELLQALLIEAQEKGSNNFNFSLSDINKNLEDKLTETKLDAYLEELLNYRAIVENTGKATLISSYFKIQEPNKVSYDIEISKTLLEQYNKNMLLDVEILKNK